MSIKSLSASSVCCAVAAVSGDAVRTYRTDVWASDVGPHNNVTPWVVVDCGLQSLFPNVYVALRLFLTLLSLTFPLLGRINKK